MTPHDQHKSPTYDKLQKQLGILLSWFDEWKHTLNTKKTVVMKFRKHLKNIEPIAIDNNVIPWSSNTRYLGIYLDRYLNFNTHITHISSKTRHTRTALYLILNNRSPIPEKTEFGICKMYIRTKILYTNPTWGALISKTN